LEAAREPPPLWQLVVVIVDVGVEVLVVEVVAVAVEEACACHGMEVHRLMLQLWLIAVATVGQSDLNFDLEAKANQSSTVRIADVQFERMVAVHLQKHKQVGSLEHVLYTPVAVLEIAPVSSMVLAVAILVLLC